MYNTPTVAIPPIGVSVTACLQRTFTLNLIIHRPSLTEGPDRCPEGFHVAGLIEFSEYGQQLSLSVFTLEAGEWISDGVKAIDRFQSESFFLSS